MTVSYVTSGPWGPGTGTLLSAATVDGNFWTLVEAINAKSAQGVGIQEIIVVHNQMSILLTDHSWQGPFTLPIAALNGRGAWQPSTTYYVGDVVTYGPSAYLVIFQHVSQLTFSPGANDGAGHNFYSLLFTFPNTLSSLADVALGSPLEAGQVLAYNGTDWQNESRADLPCGALTAVSGAISIDRSLGEVHRLLVTGNVTSTTVLNWPVSGQMGKLTLEIQSTGSFSFAWPANTIWAGASAPTLTPNGKDLYSFVTFNGGSPLYGNVIGQAYG